MAFTIKEFFDRFPDDDACLAHLFSVRYGDDPECPSCYAQVTFHKLSKVPAYTCSQCGHHIHPTAGTFMHRTHVPIRDWFYAMYLFTTSRHGVPAKELERQLGVSYPTALRMSHKIREYMGEVDGIPPMTDHVEVDETYVGGRRPKIKGFTGRSAKGKTVVFGILERGGELFTKVVPDASRKSLIPPIVENVPVGKIGRAHV